MGTRNTYAYIQERTDVLVAIGMHYNTARSWIHQGCPAEAGTLAVARWARDNGKYIFRFPALLAALRRGEDAMGALAEGA